MYIPGMAYKYTFYRYKRFDRHLTWQNRFNRSILTKIIRLFFADPSSARGYEIPRARERVLQRIPSRPFASRRVAPSTRLCRCGAQRTQGLQGLPTSGLNAARERVATAEGDEGAEEGQPGGRDAGRRGAACRTQQSACSP